MGNKPEEVPDFSDLSEADKQQEKKDLEDLKEKIDKMIPKAKDTVTSLRLAADKLDQVWMDSKIAQAGGTGATILGGLLTIGGGIATVMTLGGATPLLVAGIGVGLGGAGVKIGTSIVEAAINTNEVKAAEEKLKETFQNVNEINELIQTWIKLKEKIRLVYLCCIAVQVFESSQPVVRFLLNAILPLLDVPANILEVAGAQGARQAGAQVARQVGAQGARQAGVQGTRKAGAQGARQAGAQGARQAGAQAARQAAAQGARQAGAQGARQAGVEAAEQVAAQGARQAGAQGARLAGGLLIGVGAAFLVFDVTELGFTIRNIIENKGSHAARFLRSKADELESGIQDRMK